MLAPTALPVLGPGAMPGDGPECLPFPEEMATFRTPRLPASVSGLAEARAALAHLLAALRAWRPGEPGAPALDLLSLSEQGRQAIDATLGEGEVSALCVGAGPEETAIRARETAFAGLWRVQVVRPGGAVERDLLEAGEFPAAIRARAAAARRPVELPPPRPGLMNGPALVAELAAAARAHAEAPAGAALAPHVVNLTQLPVSEEDHAHLAAAVGEGTLAILSRGYGSCRITSTAAGNVWWVRYHNAMGQLILDTLEVSAIPEVALAAREDLEDTAARLAEWLEALEEEA